MKGAGSEVSSGIATKKYSDKISRSAMMRNSLKTRCQPSGVLYLFFRSQGWSMRVLALLVRLSILVIREISHMIRNTSPEKAKAKPGIAIQKYATSMAFAWHNLRCGPAGKLERVTGTGLAISQIPPTSGISETQLDNHAVIKKASRTGCRCLFPWTIAPSKAPMKRIWKIAMPQNTFWSTRTKGRPPGIPLWKGKRKGRGKKYLSQENKSKLVKGLIPDRSSLSVRQSKPKKKKV